MVSVIGSQTLDPVCSACDMGCSYCMYVPFASVHKLLLLVKVYFLSKSTLICASSGKVCAYIVIIVCACTYTRCKLINGINVMLEVSHRCHTGMCSARCKLVELVLYVYAI